MRGCDGSRIHAYVCTTLTFAPMDGHRLNPLEQQVLMDGIHICLLLRKDEHLSRGPTPVMGADSKWACPTFSSMLPPCPLPFIPGVLGQPGWLHSRVGVFSADTRAGIPSWPLPSHIPPPATTGARSGGPVNGLTSRGPATKPGPPILAGRGPEAYCHQGLATLRMSPAKD